MSPPSHDARDLASPAGELRRAFDASFSAAPAERTADAEPFLLLRLGHNAHAVRIGEIRGFAAARKIVPLSNGIPELLGLAGFRGSLVPVYDLAALLGYAERDPSPRWFILCGEGDATAVAFAFSEFDGYIEQPRTDARTDGPGPERGRGILHRDGVARVVIDVPSIIASVKTKAGMGTTGPVPLPGAPHAPNKSPREP